jgi:hypothetical protein
MGGMRIDRPQRVGGKTEGKTTKTAEKVSGRGSLFPFLLKTTDGFSETEEKHGSEGPKTVFRTTFTPTPGRLFCQAVMKYFNP